MIVGQNSTEAATMSDAVTGGDAGPEGGEAPKQDEAPKTFTQEQVNSFLAAQKRELTSKYADYDDVKTKATKFDEFQESKKDELQREREAREAAEKRAEKAEFASLRDRIANRPGKVVPAASLTGKTEEELIASADALIAWRDENAPKPAEKPAPKRNPAGSGGGLKSGASGADVDPTDKKELAAKRLRQMRGGE
ncbi:scaffolding protein [Mycobacterium phage ShedlockHolmes]|uniref:Scaffolding protein n=1 Tax=Mycobacterium phage ShedlockHolmes TaxID=1647313 RepID=A0A0F6WF79_9CAUD|nr:head scaffolding protein [Mycobacterium phage ShedlockHolmes]AKF15188.1 scaffolding protein [Mycobacterium phage ShedlockHolmes]